MTMSSKRLVQTPSITECLNKIFCGKATTSTEQKEQEQPFEPAKQVVDDLEKRGYDFIKKDDTTPHGFINFACNGAKEFEKRTGRPMTYAEMREAWG